MIGNPATVPGRASRIAVTSIAMALLLLGTSVMLGWWLKIAPLVQIVPGFTAMVFNTALCFTLAGAALLLPERVHWRQRAQTAIGFTIALFAALILAQDIFGVDLAVDHLFDAEWLHDYRPHPTRMAPNTAVALILSGVSLVLLPVRARWANHLTLVLTMLVAVIGSTALVGYLLRLELLFTWYPYARMALHTAIATVALAVGLVLKALQQPHFQELFGAGQDKRIVFSGSAILVTIALVSGLASFVVLERQIEVMLRNELELLLRNRVDVFHNAIDQGILATEAIATRPAIQRELRRLHAAPNDPGAIEFLRQAIGSFLPLGFSAVVLNDRHGRELVHVGTLVQQPETQLRLNTPQHAELLWDNGLTMRLQIPIRDPGGPSGTVIAERPLPLLTRLFSDIRGLGETGEMVVCAARGDDILCLPTRLNPKVFSVPRRLHGALLPMSHALDGNTGVITTSDYRGQQVIAAHSPIPQLGLGMVVKMDAASYTSLSTSDSSSWRCFCSFWSRSAYCCCTGRSRRWRGGSSNPSARHARASSAGILRWKDRRTASGTGTWKPTPCFSPGAGRKCWDTRNTKSPAARGMGQAHSPRRQGARPCRHRKAHAGQGGALPERTPGPVQGRNL